MSRSTLYPGIENKITRAINAIVNNKDKIIISRFSNWKLIVNFSPFKFVLMRNLNKNIIHKPSFRLFFGPILDVLLGKLLSGI